MKIKTSQFELAAITQGDPEAEKVALVLPGRLDTKDYTHMVSHVNFLAAQGFCAVSFDPPGSWESSGNLEDFSTTNYLQAVNEVIDQFNRPTLLLGHSRGASVAMLASNNPSVKSLVLAMANYSAAVDPSPKEIEDGYGVSYRDVPPGDGTTTEKKKFLLPLKYFDDSRQYDQAAQLVKFAGPKLIICATHDQFVSPQKVREYFDQLQPPKEFLELDTEHDYRLHADMIEAINRAVGAFLLKYWE